MRALFATVLLTCSLFAQDPPLARELPMAIRPFTLPKPKTWVMPRAIMDIVSDCLRYSQRYQKDQIELLLLRDEYKSVYEDKMEFRNWLFFQCAVNYKAESEPEKSAWYAKLEAVINLK